MAWEINITDEFRDWYEYELSEDDQEKIRSAVESLEARGPALPRPLVGEVLGSRHGHGMKELIPPSSTIRVLFRFDPRREAILLFGGDKEGKWNDWYPPAIARADALYDEYLKAIENEKKEGTRDA